MHLARGTGRKLTPLLSYIRCLWNLSHFELKWGKDTQMGRQVELERKAEPLGHFWVSLHPECWLIHSANPAGICSASSLLVGS